MSYRAVHVVVCSLVAAGAVLVLRAGAGPLDPPAGPVSPSYKTLTEVEPRTAISAVNTPGDADSIFRITQQGSYYLTGNMVVGAAARSAIEIAADNVTLDLCGFTVTSANPNSLDGITTSGVRRNITILNGTVTAFGGDGIDLMAGGGGTGCRLEGLHVWSNANNGMVALETAVVESCTVGENGRDGIWVPGNGTIRGCAVRANGRHGISVGLSIAVGSRSVIQDCTSSGNTQDGISCYAGVSITNCTASTNSRHGFALQGFCAVTGCTAQANLVNGFHSVSDAGIGAAGSSRHLFSGCVATDNDGAGIVLTAGFGTIERCTVMANGLDGIQSGSSSRIAFNSCENNGSGGDGANIHVTGTDNHIEGNTVVSGDRGIDVDGGGNLIIRNTAANNPINFDLAANNRVGVIVTAPSSAAISGSTGGAGVGSTDPTANVVY